MYTWKVRNIGSFHSSDKLVDQFGNRKLRSFLHEFMEGFSKIASSQINNSANFYEYPSFAFRERQLHTLISPTLYNICDYFIQEPPAFRYWSKNINEEDSHGWNDYACNYKGLALITEIKHDYLSYKTLEPPISMVSQWKSAKAQLSASSYDVGWYAKRSSGVFRLSLMISPIYQSSRKKVLNFEKDDIHQFSAFSSVGKILNPNFTGLWSLHNSLRGPFYDNDWKVSHFYTGVLFTSRIFKVKTKI